LFDVRCDCGGSDTATKSPLADNENPELIGKRNINKHQINFYSFDKEVAIGRQFAQEIDRSAKLIDDAVIAEYINRVGQNLVLHSDAKVPFTIKVVDSDEVNAFALPGGFFYVNKGLILTG
jgi:predicted Zn-dependent protease